MAVPKRKQSPSRTGMRRSDLEAFKEVVEDKKSGEYRLSHHVDLKNAAFTKANETFKKLIHER